MAKNIDINNIENIEVVDAVELASKLLLSVMKKIEAPNYIESDFISDDIKYRVRLEKV